jgi:hypothetical protein
MPCFNGSTAILLMTGQVLVEGSNQYLDVYAALYDEPTGTFVRTGSGIRARDLPAAVLLPDGTVLITGGAALPDGYGDPSAEIYSPASGTSTLTGSMTTGRQSHTSTLLPDGTVLVAGGYGAYPVLTASAEIYRPGQLIGPPILYSISGNGRGQGAILHAGTSRLASLSDPAVAGEYLEIYLTGLTSGSVIPPQVSIGGRMAAVSFFGNAAGYAGLNQVNVRVPSGVVPGDAVPVRLAFIGRPSNEVTIGVR